MVSDWLILYQCSVLMRLGCLLNRGLASRPEIILPFNKQAIPGEESSTISESFICKAWSLRWNV